MGRLTLACVFAYFFGVLSERDPNSGWNILLFLGWALFFVLTIMYIGNLHDKASLWRDSDEIR